MNQAGRIDGVRRPGGLILCYYLEPTGADMIKDDTIDSHHKLGRMSFDFDSGRDLSYASEIIVNFCSKDIPRAVRDGTWKVPCGTQPPESIINIGGNNALVVSRNQLVTFSKETDAKPGRRVLAVQMAGDAQKGLIPQAGWAGRIMTLNPMNETVSWVDFSDFRNISRKEFVMGQVDTDLFSSPGMFFMFL